MKKFYILFLLAFGFVHAQVTLVVNSIPANTPDGAPIFVAGNFNGWNPGDPNFQLNYNGVIWSITIPEGTGTAEYKFTRGSWATVEGDENGNVISNRSFTYTGEQQTIVHDILSWEDLGGGGQSTAAWNVSVLDEDFYIPQLDRNRKIWLYLPPDYETSTKNYPVIYMHDGQNLFDSQTAFAGEWQVDETLNSLFEAGDHGAIVVGIENGQGLRIDEYSPWINPSYGGGEGAAYMQFIVETLKPFIDANYRTMPEDDYTALIGSSLGALISTYGAVEYADTFDKIGSFSPAYWFVSDELNSYITGSAADLSDSRIYFVGSQNESETLEAEILTVKNNLQSKGLTASNTLVKMDDYGGHNEAYWAGEFAAAYEWLFAEENLDVQEVESPAEVKAHIMNGQLHLQGVETGEKVNLYDFRGRLIEKIEVRNGSTQLKNQLNPGIYFLKGENFRKKLINK